MEKKVLQVRLPAELHARLTEAKGVRSLNAEIVARLEDTFAKDVEYVSTVVSPALANTVVSSVAEVSAKVAGLPVPSAPVVEAKAAPATVFASERPRAGRRTMMCAHRVPVTAFCARCD